jgi:drug/metabolite transporter (DMT)-like permease
MLFCNAKSDNLIKQSISKLYIIVGNKKFLVFSSLILASLFWGISFIWVKQVLLTFNPISIITIRLIISSIFLLLISISIKKLQKIQKSDFSKFIFLDISEPLFYYLSETYGLKYVSSTLASLIISTIPIFVPMAAFIILKVKISKFNLIGLVVSMLGVLLIIINNSFSITASPKGLLLIFLAVFSAVSYTMILKGLSEKYNAITIVLYQNLFGLVAFLPLFFIVDYQSFIKINLSFSVFIPIITLSILPSSMSYMLFTYGVQNIGINRASIFSNAIPVFTAVCAYFILDEDFTTRKIVGIIIVLAGLTVSQINGLKK